MAPEVLQRGVVAMPADVYSYSMLMLELWEGEPVYKDVNMHQVSAQFLLRFHSLIDSTFLEIMYFETGGT